MAMSSSISSKLYQGDVVRPGRPLLPRHVVAAAAETMRTSGSAAPAVRLALESLALTGSRAEVRMPAYSPMG